MAHRSDAGRRAVPHGLDPGGQEDGGVPRGGQVDVYGRGGEEVPQGHLPGQSHPRLSHPRPARPAERAGSAAGEHGPSGAGHEPHRRVRLGEARQAAAL